MIRHALAGLSLAELQNLLQPLPAFRARQVFHWLAQGVPSFEAMTDLTLPLRHDLANRFLLYSATVSQQLEDNDGTVKLQLSLQDNTRIEAVLLSDNEGRKTACLSTQAGCPVACVFCKTGSLGFSRNLSSPEIVEQFLHLSSIADIANIVIMGMGEPLLNLEALCAALAVFTGDLGISRRRITISTSGIVKGIRELASKRLGARLACSLTTADPTLREQLMPIARANPLPRLHDALAYYQQEQGQRLTLEAVLLGGINTREIDARALGAFVRGLDVVINLITWNPISGLCFEGKPLREPSRREVERFGALLEQQGIQVTRRFRKGIGIAGACGQLGFNPHKQMDTTMSDTTR
ncbi:MAG: 23S rRNA (adenine(2503)-C(2))-methyltransferase RlmN [Treponema sp.]|jgi:23S rRNA (adenine2503-C2)-methyltransferase|nr:23S rRNA (adenine(2503)-C(2))-methyltransferase RlmN [Treponema sp.]